MLWVAALLMVMPTTVRSEEQSDWLGSGNLDAGRQKSASERCQECHGSNGVSDDQWIPNHAGQPAAYLIKQLQDFQSGARQHDTMNLMAADLTAADRADIAAYFASQVAGESEKISVEASVKNLYAQGDPQRNLPACAKCHGDRAQGQQVQSVAYPRLAGQKRVYLHSQLVNWRIGERHNSPDAVMNDVAKVLTEDEIEALSRYLSSL